MTLSFVQTGNHFTSVRLELTGDYTTQLYANKTKLVSMYCLQSRLRVMVLVIRLLIKF